MTACSKLILTKMTMTTLTTLCYWAVFKNLRYLLADVGELSYLCRHEA